MSAKQTISFLALSALMILPAEIATAGNIKVQNGNSRVIINRNGDIKIRNNRRIRLHRRRIRRGSAIVVPSNNIYRQTIKKRGNCTTYRSTRKTGSGNNRSYARTRTTTCQ